MKRNIFFLMLILCQLKIAAFVPQFFGARCLSLGYASSVYNYDLNSIHLNPSLLSFITSSIGGFQYQFSYLDYREFDQKLADILAFDLNRYGSLSNDKKKELIGKLTELFSFKTGIYGNRSKNSGFIQKGYGVSIQVIDEAIMNPIDNENLKKPYDTLTETDIAGLKMNFIGWHYTQYSFAYGFAVSKSMYAGLTVHYLKGKITEFTSSLTTEPFSLSASSKDYLQYAWNSSDQSLSKVNMDMGLAMDIGQFFKVGLAVKNVFKPVFKTGSREIVLQRKMTAGIAFHPDIQWGIFLDIDITKTDCFYNETKTQPVSSGSKRDFSKINFLSEEVSGMT